MTDWLKVSLVEDLLMHLSIEVVSTSHALEDGRILDWYPLIRLRRSRPDMFFGTARLDFVLTVNSALILNFTHHTYRYTSHATSIELVVVASGVLQ